MDTEQQAATEEQSPERAARPRRNRPTRDRAGGQRPANPAYRRLSNPFEPIRLLSDDQVEALHRAALDILQETGMRVLHAEARDIFRQAGAAIDPRLARWCGSTPIWCSRRFATAPGEFELTAGSPERSVRIGGRNLAISTVGGPPNVFDIETGKRPGTARRLPGFHAPRAELRRHPPHQSVRRAARRAAGRRGIWR